MVLHFFISITENLRKGPTFLPKRANSDLNPALVKSHYSERPLRQQSIARIAAQSMREREREFIRQTNITYGITQ